MLLSEPALDTKFLKCDLINMGIQENVKRKHKKIKCLTEKYKK